MMLATEFQGKKRASSPPSTVSPHTPTPSKTPSVWEDARWACSTLMRCPPRASGTSGSDIPAAVRGRQLRLQHSEAFVSRLANEGSEPYVAQVEGQATTAPGAPSRRPDGDR